MVQSEVALFCCLCEALRVGRGVLFREVSTFQRCPYRAGGAHCIQYLLAVHRVEDMGKDLAILCMFP